MGIVKQTRDLSKVMRIKEQWYKQGTNVLADVSYRSLAIPGSQETTSYRSSALDPTVVTTDDLRVLRPARYVVGTHDSGHEFQTCSARLLTTTTLSNFWTRYSGYDIRLDGDAIVKPSPLPWGNNAPDRGPMSMNELIVLGGRAISATIPTKPKANLAQALGELSRDGVPSLLGRTLLKGKFDLPSVGGEYLNTVFGWEPLIKDVKALLNSVVNSAEILRQFRRDSGRVVRRRFSFPEVRTLTETGPEILNGSSTYVFPFTGSMLWSPGTVTTTDLSQTNVWFSGAYSYYLDVGDSLMSKAEEFEQKANYLLGTRLTAEVFYDLTPWSWLADWFGTVGTALSNVSALQEDGLVIRYGYLMRHTVVTRTERSNPGLFGHDKRTLISSLYRTERKERWKATPYGFGLDFAGFSPRQWAILAALGMTKSPGVAR